jgi:cystathionine beta-lyase
VSFLLTKINLEVMTMIVKSVYELIGQTPLIELDIPVAKGSRILAKLESFELKDGLDTKKFVESLKVISLAESLGGIESLIEVPAVMTHGSIPREIRLENGIKDELIRLSVGIEDEEDLINDLK